MILNIKEKKLSDFSTYTDEELLSAAKKLKNEISKNNSYQLAKKVCL